MAKDTDKPDANETEQEFAFDHVMHEQQLLFDGYMRMELVSQISINSHSNLITDDVINLCNNFFKLEIQSLMINYRDELLKKNQNYTWLHTDWDDPFTKVVVLGSLCDELRESKEFWVSHKILMMLLDINDKSDSFNEASTFYNKLGLLYRDWNDTEFDEARAAYKKAIELEPKESIYKYNYGFLLLAENAYQSALEQFKAAMELDTHDPDYPKKCGDCHQEMKEYDAAKQYYIKAFDLEEDKDSKDVYYRYGLCYSNIDEFELAIDHFKKAIEFAPDDPLYYMECGICYRWLEDTENARRYLSKAIEIDKNNAVAHTDYAAFLRMDCKELEKAQEHCAKAIELDSSHGNAYYEMARIFRDMKKFDEK